MSDLREALARAICASCNEIPDHPGDCQGNQYRWQDYLPCADAALAEMSGSCVVKKYLATKGIRTPTIDQEFMRVTYLDDEATKQAVFDRVMAYFTKHQAFGGESIHQRDNPTIDAPCVLADIADNIIRFQVEYKD